MGSGPPPNSARNWAESGLSSSPKVAIAEIMQRKRQLDRVLIQKLREIDIDCEADDD